MVEDEVKPQGIKYDLLLEKYAPGHEVDGFPDEVLRVVVWKDEDGNVITDEGQIAELETFIATAQQAKPEE